MVRSAPPAVHNRRRVAARRWPPPDPPSSGDGVQTVRPLGSTTLQRALSRRRVGPTGHPGGGGPSLRSAVRQLVPRDGRHQQDVARRLIGPPLIGLDRRAAVGPVRQGPPQRRKGRVIGVSKHGPNRLLDGWTLQQLPTPGAVRLGGSTGVRRPGRRAPAAPRIQPGLERNPGRHWASSTGTPRRSTTGRLPRAHEPPGATLSRVIEFSPSVVSENSLPGS